MRVSFLPLVGIGLLRAGTLLFLRIAFPRLVSLRVRTLIGLLSGGPSSGVSCVVGAPLQRIPGLDRFQRPFGDHEATWYVPLDWLNRGGKVVIAISLLKMRQRF